MCECYGGMPNMPRANLYKEAMDQFAKGINLFVPHAVWYDSANVDLPAGAVAAAAATMGPLCRGTTATWAGCSACCSGAGTWPTSPCCIRSRRLQAGYRFGVGMPYDGRRHSARGRLHGRRRAACSGPAVRLHLPASRDARRALPAWKARRCGWIYPERFEQYRVLILPGSTTIHASNLRKIKQFYDAGGAGASPRRGLPNQSVEPGHDGEVRELIAAMFGSGERRRRRFLAEPFHPVRRPRL